MNAMMTSARDLVGRIHLPSPDDFDGALVIVRLDEVTYSDAPARRIAEALFSFSGQHVEAIPFRLPLQSLPVHARLTLSAEIHRSGSPGLGSVDYRNVVATPWHPHDLAAESVIDVQNIGTHRRRGT